MNSAKLFFQQAKDKPHAMAICIPGQESITFGELRELSLKARTLFRKNGAGPGVSVLLVDQLSGRLYASIIALLSLGATIILVEPWLPVARIQKVIELTQPQLFVSNLLGFLWGGRVKGIRKIPHWIKCSAISSHSPDSSSELEDIDPGTAGIVTFTSGTTGAPKGVVRSHGYMETQREVLSKYLETGEFKGTDLCIFANFALLNLASGRGSVIVPSKWSHRTLEAIDQLPSELQPETLTCGPAFLLRLFDSAKLPKLKSIHIGGALTDCWIFEKGFQLWPEADWCHIYGGSEVEPVAITDARKAVEESRKRGLFQTLYLGKNVPEIRSKIDSGGLWVAGPHVCPEYLGNPEENRLLKKKDSEGVLWHFMGDRILEDPSGWWYQGRAGQPQEDFLMEQEIYQKFQSSKSFIYSKGNSTPSLQVAIQWGKWLVGENLKGEIRKDFPELSGCINAKIYRDRRHRARIDRTKTLKKGASWLSG